MRPQPGQHKNSRPNDGAHAQGRQLEDAERALQTVFARLFRLINQAIERLFRQKVSHS
jgi:hypothetical protein